MAEVIRVSARSRAPAVAGAIAGVVREHGRADVQAIGAGAVNHRPHGRDTAALEVLVQRARLEGGTSKCNECQ